MFIGDEQLIPMAKSCLLFLNFSYALANLSPLQTCISSYFFINIVKYVKNKI